MSYSLRHFPSSKGRNKAHSIDFERLLQLKKSMFAVFALCSEREAHPLCRQNPVPTIFRRFLEPFRLLGEEKGPFSTSNISAMF